MPGRAVSAVQSAYFLTAPPLLTIFLTHRTATRITSAMSSLFLNMRLLTRRRSAIWSLAWLLLFSLPHARATTVIPPDFDSLVSQADYVIRGIVKSVNATWQTRGADRVIVTRVEITVTETIAGSPPSQVVLEMLGGRVGTDRMVVHGSPDFRVNDEHILFIRGNGVQFNPLVALMHGQYPIKKDAGGRSYMARSDGSPLADVSEVARPIHASGPSASRAATAATPATTESALTPAEFSARIRASRQKSATATP